MSLLISSLSGNNFSPKYFRFKRRTQFLSPLCLTKVILHERTESKHETRVSFSRIRKRMKVIFILSPRDNQRRKEEDSFQTLPGMQLTYLCFKIKRKVIRHAFMSFSFLQQFWRKGYKENRKPFILVSRVQIRELSTHCLSWVRRRTDDQWEVEQIVWIKRSKSTSDSCQDLILCRRRQWKWRNETSSLVVQVMKNWGYFCTSNF